MRMHWNEDWHHVREWCCSWTKITFFHLCHDIMDDLLVALGNIILLLLVEGIHDKAVIWVALLLVNGT